MARKENASEPGDESAGGPGPGHNGPVELTAEQRQALFFHHLVKIRKLKEALASASGALRAAYKVAKSDSVAKKDLDYAIALERKDEDDLLEERKRHDEIARWLQHPVGMQADMFDGVDRTPASDRAFEEGKIAGMQGKSLQPPYDASTEQGQRWIEGWHVGQAAIFNIQRMKDAETFDGDGGGDGDDDGEDAGGEADAPPLVGDQEATHRVTV